MIDILRKFDDPYPCFPGLMAEIGFHNSRIEFNRPKRKRGISKSNLVVLYNMALLGIISYTKISFGLAAKFGSLSGIFNFYSGVVYLSFKLVDWQDSSLGRVPGVIGLIFIGSLPLFILGIVGKFIGSICTLADRRFLIIEKERKKF